MGALHEGHCALIKAARRLELQNPLKVLTSVFVNPLQFGPSEDFDKYPRSLNKDCELAKIAGANAIWAPSVEDIFPGGNAKNFKILAPPNLQNRLCGINRPGHFDGVVTVVARLLSLVRPEVLVLGEKDWQQLVILRQLLTDLAIPVRIQAVPTKRDHDDIAWSSRNTYLSPNQRKDYQEVPKLLKQTGVLYKIKKNIDLPQLRYELQAKGLEVEYLEAIDPYTLEPTKLGNKLCLLATAVRSGKTRLIDHIFLMTRKPIVAIDGPAGAGKSTVTKNVAKRLGLIYLDTGAMYRGVTWMIQQNNIDPHNESEIKKAIKELRLELSITPSGNQKVMVNGSDVTNAIRTQDISKIVSTISSYHCVREALTNQQKQMGENGGLIAEGRDIGSIVFPKAELKVFLTASVEERAKRRAQDIEARGFSGESLDTIRMQIEERDRLDRTREISPLVKAEDAIEIVTDGMTIKEVEDSIIEVFQAKVPQEVWPSL